MKPSSGRRVVDFGGGSTTVGVFRGGRLIHVDAVAVGGIHVTRDIARGLSVSVTDAERLKTLYGACIASPSDDRESVAVNRLGDDMDHPSHLPKSELLRIIRPARRGDPRTRARPAARLRPCCSGGAPACDDGWGLPADRTARVRARGHLQSGPYRAASRESRACPNRARALRSQRPSDCWSIRRWPDSNISNRARRRAAGARGRRICGSGRALAEGELLGSFWTLDDDEAARQALTQSNGAGGRPTG